MNALLQGICIQPNKNSFTPLTPCACITTYINLLTLFILAVQIATIYNSKWKHYIRTSHTYKYIRSNRKLLLLIYTSLTTDILYITTVL